MPDVKKGAEAPFSKMETSKKPSEDSLKKVGGLNATRDAYIAVRDQKKGAQESKANSIEKEDAKKNSFAGAAVELVEDAGKFAAEAVTDIFTLALNTVMHGPKYATEYRKATDSASNMDVEELTNLIDQIDDEIKDVMNKDNDDDQEEEISFSGKSEEEITIDEDTEKAIRDAAKSIKDNNNEGTDPNAEVDTAAVVKSEEKRAKREASQHQ